MNRTRISLTAALLSLCLLLSGRMMPPAESTVTSFFSGGYSRLVGSPTWPSMATSRIFRRRT